MIAKVKIGYCTLLQDPYLDSAHVRVLGSVFVLVKTIFCEFPLFQIDTEFYEGEHDRLKRSDGAVSRSFGGDMFMKYLKRCRSLFDGDELLCSLPSIMISIVLTKCKGDGAKIWGLLYLEDIFRSCVRWRRHLNVQSNVSVKRRK